MSQHRIKKVRVLIFTIILCMVAALNWGGVSAKSEARTEIQIPLSGNYTITNAEGKTLNYSKGNGFSGDMRVFDAYGPFLGDEPSMLTMYVERSSSYSIVNNEKTETVFSFWGEAVTYGEIKGAERVTWSDHDGYQVVSATGKNIDYFVQVFLKTFDRMIDARGHADSAFSISDKGDTLVFEGVSNRLSVENWDINKMEQGSQAHDLFVLRNPVVLSNLGSASMKATGAVKLSPKEYPAVQVLHARKTADPNALLLDWGKVKKAKGYMVYRWNPGTKKYRKVAVISGKSNRAWVDKDLSASKVYRYKVSSYTLKGKKKIESKKSYWVNAVTQDPLRENVYSVAVNKSRIAGKKGKTVRLKATVVTAQGKQALNKSVRWYTMDRKVATVDSKGVVKFKKKGVCYVYAKAHDGINSRKVKVVVQ